MFPSPSRFHPRRARFAPRRKVQNLKVLIAFVNFGYFFYLPAMSSLAIFRAVVSRLTKRQRTAAVVNSRVTRL